MLRYWMAVETTDEQWNSRTISLQMRRVGNTSHGRRKWWQKTALDIASRMAVANSCYSSTITWQRSATMIPCELPADARLLKGRALGHDWDMIERFCIVSCHVQTQMKDEMYATWLRGCPGCDVINVILRIGMSLAWRSPWGVMAALCEMSSYCIDWSGWLTLWCLLCDSCTTAAANDINSCHHLNSNCIPDDCWINRSPTIQVRWLHTERSVSYAATNRVHQDPSQKIDVLRTQEPAEACCICRSAINFNLSIIIANDNEWTSWNKWTSGIVSIATNSPCVGAWVTGNPTNNNQCWMLKSWVKRVMWAKHSERCWCAASISFIGVCKPM